MIRYIKRINGIPEKNEFLLPDTNLLEIVVTFLRIFQQIHVHVH